jgi:hypothetical protein
MSTVVRLKPKSDLPILRCTACLKTVDAPCECGAPIEVLRPRDAAAKALAADPTKSNVAIAEEIGISDETVRKVRNSHSNKLEGDDDEPERVTGKDGKKYPAKRKAKAKVKPVGKQKTDTPTQERKSTRDIIDDFVLRRGEHADPPVAATTPTAEESAESRKAEYAAQEERTKPEEERRKSAELILDFYPWDLKEELEGWFAEARGKGCVPELRALLSRDD